jgi:hypothetical protein
LVFLCFSVILSCKKTDTTPPVTDSYINPTTQPSELSRAFKVKDGVNNTGDRPTKTTSTNLKITKFQTSALITADNYLFIPLIAQTTEAVSGIYFQVVGADNYWVVNTTLAPDKSQVISIEVPFNVLNGNFEILYGLKGVSGGIGEPISLKAKVASPLEYCSNGKAPELISGSDGLVNHSLTFGDKVGWVTIDYDTYTVPDRIDIRYNNKWVASTGSVLSGNSPPTKLCSSVTPGDGFIGAKGSFKIFYDGKVSKKLDIYVSGCLEGGTLWEFKVRDCPTWYSGLPDCPCKYSQAQDSAQKPAGPEGKWQDKGAADQDYHYGATNEVRWIPSKGGDPGQQCTYDANGNLITKGIAAGSPDRVSPGSSGGYLCPHYREDVIPWGDVDPLWAFGCSNGTSQPVSCWDYLTNWPANNRLACSNKIVSGIEHMLAMIGKMTCEEATLLIKRAKESSVIDIELKNYILGNLSYTPATLKTKLINWRNSNSCSPSSPSDLCKVIDKAIANL